MLMRGASCGLALILLSGCGSLQGPGYIHPGDVEYQRAQAQRFDPYPLPDVAPDTYTRPLAFNRPAPVNERAQNIDAFVKRYRQAPPPNVYHAPRSSTGRQEIQYIPGAVPAQPAIGPAPPFPGAYPAPTQPPPPFIPQ